MFDVRQEITAGNTLVREAIQSQNFVSGSSGWQIKADGNAEFNNIVIRGTVVVGTDPGQHIFIGKDNINRPIIQFYSGDPNEATPGFIRTSPLGQTALQISSPINSNAPVGSITPEIDLQSWPGSASSLNLFADQLFTNNPIMLDTSWVTLTGILLNGWVDVAGSRVRYFKDATGRVQLQGTIISGAGLVFTLPLGYRPSQSMEWIMRAGGGVIMCAVQVSTNGQITVTANAGSAQTSGVRLDSISYPIL